MPRPVSVLCLVVSLWLPRSASAADTWSEVRPGVDLLHRKVSGSDPQELWAVRVDLTRETVGVRASMDATGSERAVGTNTFAQSVGALVAIDGDWSNGTTPVGLAIGNGFQWHDHYDNPSIGGRWGYFGCDVFNQCEIGALPVLSESWWFATPTIAPYRWYNAVGANGNLLLEDGARGNGCYDGCNGDTCKHPRSAVCLDQAGDTLWFIAIDGRRSGASGMTCGQVRDLAQELGCWDGAMLDGGGSTALWVDGDIVNQPSDGAPRKVANHVGILYADAVSGECALAQGAWCEGDRIRTCNGGRLVNDGDCAAFGTTCQEDGDWAFCVDPRCPAGDGLGAECLDGTRVAGCTDGVYGEGDCSVFGLVCGADVEGAGCMDARCPSGPYTGACLSDTLLADCSEGVYAEVACGEGESCVEADGDARCVGPEPEDTDDEEQPDETGRPELEEDEGLVAPWPQTRTETSCGCGAGLQPGPWGLLALALAFFRRRA